MFTKQIIRDYAAADKAACLKTWQRILNILCEYGLHTALRREGLCPSQNEAYRRIPHLSTLWQISVKVSIPLSTLVDAVEVETDLTTGGLFHHVDLLVPPPDK